MEVDFDSPLEELLLPRETEVPDLEEDELLEGVLIDLPEDELLEGALIDLPEDELPEGVFIDLPEPELLTVVLRPEEEDDLILEGVLEGVLTAPLFLAVLLLTLPGT